MKANLPEDYFEVLRKITDKTENGPEWVLSGNTNLAFRGMGIKPTYINILTGKKVVYEFRKKFREYIMKDVRQKELERRGMKIKFHAFHLRRNMTDIRKRQI